MATEVLKRQHTGDNRIVFRASWDEYQALARTIGDQRVRLAYDSERVELMSPGPEHEAYAVLIDRLIWALGDALAVPCKSMRSTRWEREEVSRGLEADSSFYLTAEKIAVARRRPKQGADWPIPDLAFEVDMSPSAIDRPGIYTALGVTEVWRFDGETLRIDRRGPDGTDADAPESLWFGVRPDEVVSLLSLDAEDDNDFSKQVVEWARNILVPRHQARLDDGGAGG